MVPYFNGLSYDFSTLWCEYNMHSVETILPSLDFDVFWASGVKHDTPRMLGSGSEPTAPVICDIRRVNN